MSNHGKSNDRELSGSDPAEMKKPFTQNRTGTMTSQRTVVDQEKLERMRTQAAASLNIQHFKDMLANSNSGKVVLTLNEKLQHLPEFRDDDWQDPLIYLYYAIYYFDEQLFNVIYRRINQFKNFQYVYQFFQTSSYNTLTVIDESNFARQQLVQLAFEAAVEKNHEYIAENFIGSKTVYLTWEMVRKMLQNNQITLLKNCIKYKAKFDQGDASVKKIRFKGRASTPEEKADEGVIRLVDLVHVMLEQKWKTKDIKSIIETQKITVLDQKLKRDLFLLFAIKRKIKLMNFLLRNQASPYQFKEADFIDVLENSAFDMAVLLFREFFPDL
jgi:hypothetical protein